MNVFKKLLLILFIIDINFAFANKYPPASLSSPRDTMNYFLKTMKGYKLGDTDALDMALKALSLKHLSEDLRLISGRLAAKQLVNTLDRIEYIDITKIPDPPTKDIWVYRKAIVEVEEESHAVEISIAKDEDGKWRFTQKTLEGIPFYEKFLQQNKVVKGVTELADFKTRFKNAMPEWTGKKMFMLKNGQWLGIFIVILLSLIVEKIMRLYIARMTMKLLAKYEVDFSTDKQKRFTMPIGIATFAGFWTLAVRLLELEANILAALLRAGYVLFTIGCVVTAHHLVDVFCLYLEKLAKESENKFDDILVPLVSKTSKFFIISIGIIFIGNSLTLDMKSIIAGMGIGGIAFALAAKDTVSNLFGSLTVLLDRPFRIGDWVLIDEKIEGTVEEVGLRSTRIRTFYDSLITVPNGKLTNVHIDNYGQRTYRRLSTKIGVQYDTPPELLEAFCEGIRQIIINHKYTRKEYFHVYFNSFGDSSLNILLYVFWKVPDWPSELNEKHRLLMDILRLGEKMGVKFAFPTRTLHLYNENKESPSEVDLKESMQQAKDLGIALSENTLATPAHRSAASQMS